MLFLSCFTKTFLLGCPGIVLDQKLVANELADNANKEKSGFSLLKLVAQWSVMEMVGLEEFIASQAIDSASFTNDT